MGTLLVTPLEFFGIIQFDGEFQIFSIKAIQTVLGAGLHLRPPQTFIVQIQLLQHILDAVPHDFPFRPIFHGDFFQNPIRQNRCVHSTVRIQLKIADHAAIMTANGHFRQLGNGDFLAADNGNRPNKTIFRIRALLFDSQIIVNTLIQHLQNKIRLFLVSVLGFRFKMLIGIN